MTPHSFSLVYAYVLFLKPLEFVLRQLSNFESQGQDVSLKSGQLFCINLFADSFCSTLFSPDSLVPSNNFLPALGGGLCP